VEDRYHKATKCVITNAMLLLLSSYYMCDAVCEHCNAEPYIATVETEEAAVICSVRQKRHKKLFYKFPF